MTNGICRLLLHDMDSHQQNDPFETTPIEA